jgi:group II intron reverse transcriptase/maturase
MAIGLPSLHERVRKLQTSLQAKAKAEPTYRFYTLWDKVCRVDVLAEAYRRCRANRGAPGVDGETFEAIEDHGVEAWLERLRQELCSRAYRPRPLLRVWIPKSNGGQRPLSIPPIRDRVVQAAMVIVLEPIFEADLLPNQYGFRPKLDAKMAVRRAYWHITDSGRTEVVDADLRDYFGSIPHGPLLRCVARRVADGTVLSVIKSWLETPVVERTPRGDRRTAEARNRHRGTPQGAICSPLLSNLYFRRFLLAWERHGHRQRLDAHVVNYADDLVICCRPGNGETALAMMRQLMTRLGLTVNEAKTQLARLPETSFVFLGYEIGRLYGKDGVPFIGTRPSKRAVKRLIRAIHDATMRRWYADEPINRIKRLNTMIWGWAAYFNQGPVVPIYRTIRLYTERRVRRWLMRRSGRRGTGYRQYPDAHLYEGLGLYKLPDRRADLPNAKA